MDYPTYLVHFNKNHSKKNGQFTYGDGDGDGTADEHHRYTKDGRRIDGKVSTFDALKINRLEKSRKKFSREFNESENGKKLQKATQKADKNFLKDRENADSKGATKKANDSLSNYYKTAKDQELARARYIATNMIKKYGAKTVASLSFFDHDTDPLNVHKSTIVYKDIDDLIEKYSQIYAKSSVI